MNAVLLAALLGVLCSEPERAQTVQFLSKPVDAPLVSGAPSVIDELHAWVGLAYTADGGISWVGRYPPTASAKEFATGEPWTQPTIFVTSERGWLSGLGSKGGGALWMTDDGGLTWRLQMQGFKYMMAFAGKSGWLALGDEHSARNYTTNDLGETWNACGEPWDVRQAHPWGSTWFIDSRNGWTTIASVDRWKRPVIDRVARTWDGGCTWKAIWHFKKFDYAILGGFQFIDASYGWAVVLGWTDQAETPRQTTDGGQHWTRVPLPKGFFKLEDFYLVSRTEAWIVAVVVDETEKSGVATAVFHTTDGATHWTRVPDVDVQLGRGLPPSWTYAFFEKARAASSRKHPSEPGQ